MPAALLSTNQKAIKSLSIRSSKPCTSLASTCSRATKRHHWPASPSMSLNVREASPAKFVILTQPCEGKVEGPAFSSQGQEPGGMELFKLPIVNNELIFQPHTSILLKFLKQISNRSPHCRIPDIRACSILSRRGTVGRGFRLRHIRRRNDAPLQPFERQQLRIRKRDTPHLRRSKKAGNPLRSEMLPLHSCIIDPKLAQQLFISIVKAIATQATFVIHNSTPPAASQNPHKLSPRAGKIKPVQRLSNSNQIERMRRQSRRFRSAIHTTKSRILLSQSGADSAHLSIRLNCCHFITASKKNFSQQSGSGRNISNQR